MVDKKNTDQFDKMTKTPVMKLILTLSVPSIISMMVNNIYNLVDTAFVGRLGTSASGAVGIVFGFMAIVQAFGFMFGQGSGSILSRLLGQRDKQRASLHASVGLISSFICGLIITVFGLIFLDNIVMILGSTPTIKPFAKDYIFYILLATPFMCSSLTLNNILRYEGKAMLGMIGIMVGVVLNIISDPIFMFAFNMGIKGAGIATAISQVISWVILIEMFISGRTETKISIKAAKEASPNIVLNIMATGFPSLLRQGLNSLTTMILNLQCSVYSDAAVAAMSIVSRIVFFTFSIAIGIGQGFQPVSAFNYGAKKYSRVRKGYIVTLLMSEAIIIIGCLMLYIFSDQLISIFRNDAKVILIGTRALKLQSLATILLPPCMATEMLFQSTGKRLGASLISSLRSGILLIPSLLILSQLRGLSGIQEAQPVSLLLSFPLTMIFAIAFFKKLPKSY